MERFFVLGIALRYSDLALFQSVKIGELIEETPMKFHGLSGIFDSVSVAVAYCFHVVLVLVGCLDDRYTLKDPLRHCNNYFKLFSTIFSSHSKYHANSISN